MKFTNNELLYIRFALEKLAGETFNFILEKKALYMNAKTPETTEEQTMFEIEWIDYETGFWKLKKTDQNPFIREGIEEIHSTHHQLKELKTIIEKCHQNNNNQA